MFSYSSIPGLWLGLNQFHLSQFTESTKLCTINTSMTPLSTSYNDVLFDLAKSMHAHLNHLSPVANLFFILSLNKAFVAKVSTYNLFWCFVHLLEAYFMTIEL